MSLSHSQFHSTPILSKGKSSLPFSKHHNPAVSIDAFLTSFKSSPLSSSSPASLSDSNRVPLPFYPTKRASRRRLKKRLRIQLAARPVPAIHSVFHPPTLPLQPSPPPIPPRTLDHGAPTSLEEFENVVRLVKLAIENPTKPLLPKLNGSGSSGSYFCRAFLENNQAEDEPDKADTVAIFKPKDEEPYGAMNPKWTKWAHRVFLAPIIGGFGRSCLIPNLSYLSEAAASLLDRRLSIYIVPRTEVVSLSSPTFFYSWLDLRRPSLPPKPGSFQLFCRGFENASTFLKAHPWPGKPVPDSSGIRRKRTRRCSFYRLLCGVRPNPEDSASDTSEDENDEEEEWETKDDGRGQEWQWTSELMDDFRGEMEKLVILDYLMRNTDRGLDNFMIKICNLSTCHGRRSRKASTQSTSSTPAPPVDAQPDSAEWATRAHCHVAAIDNSLAFPHHHPNGWRAYAYGWLFLPASLIGQPFSRATREHYLPLLTSANWWAETVHALRKLFGGDPDFNVAMFERQMAVLKGQAWNVVESLKHADEGPLELCRRQKALVWDEPVEGEPTGPAGEPEARSAPASQPYFAMPPMRVVEQEDRPRIGRRYTTRAAGSSRVPRRPVGLASHHLSIDGARGLDVMNQMDALEAWQIDGEGHGAVDTYGACVSGRHVSELAVPKRLDEVEGEEDEDEDDGDEDEDDEEDDEDVPCRSESSRLLPHHQPIQKGIKSDSKSLTNQSQGGLLNPNKWEFSKKRNGKTSANPSLLVAGAGVGGRLGVVERVEFVDVNPVFKNC